MRLSDFTYGDNFDGSTALITGGAGFIGSHIARRLLALGASVRILDDLSTGFRENVPSSAEFIEGSILDAELVRETASDCDYVFHEAAMVSVPSSVADPAKCVAVNCTGTQHVIDAAKDGGAKRIVFASSAAVYGDEPSLPSEEDDVLDPRSPYAATKAAGENLLHAYSACFELSTVSLRYFNVFGPGQSSKSAYAAAIAAFSDALTNNKQPTIFGDGKQTRDFVFIDNVVHANLLAASCDHDLRGQAINIGTGQRIDLLRVLKAMSDALGVAVSPRFAPRRPGDVRDSCANISRTKNLLGYEPIVSFEVGIKELVKVNV